MSKKKKKKKKNRFLKEKYANFVFNALLRYLGIFLKS